MAWKKNQIIVTWDIAKIVAVFVLAPCLTTGCSRPAPSSPPDAPNVHRQDLPTAPPEAALHVAAARGDLEKVRSLLAAGADPNAPAANYFEDESGQLIVGVVKRGTPLHSACLMRHADVVRELLSAGARVDLYEDLGRQPLHDAVRLIPTDDTFKIIDLLLQHGADINGRSGTNFYMRPGIVNNDPWKDNLPEFHPASNHEGVIPLHCTSDPSVVNYLLERGADIHVKSDVGFTALHYAAFSWHEIAQILLRKGADVNAKSLSSVTPLHCAASMDNDLPLVELLIEHGADASAKDIRNETPLDYAKKAGDPQVIAIIEQAIGEQAK